jgi:hypothetical protein
MPYWVYILQNEKTGKLYKGQTSDLESRLKRHNSHEKGSMRYTYRIGKKGHGGFFLTKVESRQKNSRKSDQSAPRLTNILKVYCFYGN